VDIIVVWHLLRYGRPETRRRLVSDLLREGDTQIWHVLARTVHSPEPWELRVRCLEALGFAAANAERGLATQILAWTSGADRGLSLDGTLADALTGREREVAMLVAHSLSNRQVAERLAISPGTVRAHVQHILSKLKVPKRAAIGAWIGRQAQRDVVTYFDAAAPTEPRLRERNQESVH
jgi:DNA-binding CsgD family transcriptional regulator